MNFVNCDQKVGVMYRYFLHKYIVSNITKSKYIVRNSPNEEVTINENIDMPYISIDLDLMKEKSFERPQTDEYNKYKEIKKEDFYNYLFVTFDALKTFKSVEAEIYFDKPFSSRYEIVFFSMNPKHKFRFDIQVNNRLEWGDVRVLCSRSFSRKRFYKEKAIPVSGELFEYILIKTYEYLEDDLHYIENFREYLKLIDLSYQGKINPILPDKTVNINPLIIELTNEIRQFETRLLNYDNDTKEAREKLRGKIEGLKSAIHSINNFFSNVE